MKFEGTQVNIPIKGIMRAGTDNVCADGAMNEVVGMEYKDGSWLPYKEKEEAWEVWHERTVDDGNGGTVTQEEIVSNILNVYVHKTSDGTSHYVFVVRVRERIMGSTPRSKNTLWYEVERNDIHKIIKVAPLDSTLDSTTLLVLDFNSVVDVKDVSFIGNILCAATSAGIEYYIWKESAYEKTAKQVISLGGVSLRVTSGFKLEGDTLLGATYGAIFKETPAETTLSWSIVSTKCRELIQSSVIAALGAVRDRGGLTGYAIGCVAYRMKNGSFVAASSPVILASPMAKFNSSLSDEGYREACYDSLTGELTDDFPRLDSGTKKIYQFYQDNPLVHTPGGSLYTLINNYSEFEGVKEVLQSASPNYGCKYRDQYPAFYLQCLAGYPSASPEELVVRTKYAQIPTLLVGVETTVNPGADGVRKWQFHTYAAGNGLEYKIDDVTVVNNLRNLDIESVCFFMTEQVSPFVIKEKLEDYEKMFTGQSGTQPIYGSGGADTGKRGQALFVTRKLETRITEELKELNSFYLVDEIRLDDLAAPDTWTPIDLSGKLGDNLVVREQLPLTAITRMTTYPESLGEYNYRLHQYDYSQEDFKGFPLSEFSHNGGIGQYDQSRETSLMSGFKWEITVEISDDNGNSTVVNYTKAETYAVITSLAPLLSYPSLKATKMIVRLYKLDDSIWYEHEYPLSPIESLGISAYIDPMLKPIDIARDAMTSDFPSEIPVSRPNNNIHYYHNGLKVSDVAYPSYFPAEYTYRIGNGRIIGLARLTIPVAQDNFGRNSLIIFCTDGIYSLRVDASGNGVYTDTDYVSPEVCVNKNTICEIGGAVFFAGDKGLMMLTGDTNGNVQLYAPHLNGAPRFLPAATASKEAHGVYKKMIDSTAILSKEDEGDFAPCISKDDNEYAKFADFADFLKDANTHLVYISIKNKLLAYNESKGYTYFIDIPTGNTTKIAMSAFCDNGEVLDKEMWEEGSNGKYTVHTFKYLSKTDNEIPSLIVTRPIKVQQDDKCSYRVVLTGYFEGLEGNWADLLVLGSLDADHWRVIGVKEKKLVGGFHNLGCLTERGSWKYLMFIFGGKLSHESHIDSVDITVEGRYNNKKR